MILLYIYLAGSLITWITLGITLGQRFDAFHAIAWCAVWPLFWYKVMVK